ncbi:MAG: hypothetical protein NZ533_09245 [Casimicrobiaceae bacterium]|nr:hypothetical protein [Casimicrobiaceae bacterium]MCX8099117.1 hypothetical protein [Casimicrobiaceae bacterium]MDW8312184.1 hypothetical protein [Burkholderiales bacterium]
MTLRRLTSFLAANALFALAGCATWPMAERVTLEQLVARARQGESIDQLVALVRTQRAYGLTGSDFARLRAEGLPDRVLDELHRLELAAAEERERLRLWEPPWPRYRWYVPHVIVIKPPSKSP